MTEMTVSAPILLTMHENGTGFLIFGPDDDVATRRFTFPDDAIEFLGWATLNNVAAEALFDVSIHHQGARCWVITPADDDAAMALTRRWL